MKRQGSFAVACMHVVKLLSKEIGENDYEQKI